MFIDVNFILCRELQREKTWSRIHLVPLMLAEGDRDTYRRQQAALEREKEIMKDVKGWEVSEYVELCKMAVLLIMSMCYSIIIIIITITLRFGVVWMGDGMDDRLARAFTTIRDIGEWNRLWCCEEGGCFVLCM